MTLADLLARPHALLDFDGPVCAVFGAIPADHIARHYAAVLRAHHIEVPDALVTTGDPLAIFAAVGTDQPAHAEFAEHALRYLETHTVATAPITPGIVEALDALHAAGRTVTIVSNNSADAVRAFLARHDLDDRVRAVMARRDPDPALLKPSPHLVTQTVDGLNAAAGQCVLIGDSITDITAGHAAGVAVIAYANRPGKAARFAPHHPDAVIDTMHAIPAALAATSTGPRG